MKRSTLIGFSLGFITLSAFICALGMTMNSPIAQWLSNAVMGIAFSFAFGLSFPPWLAYIATGLTFLLIGTIGFVIGKFVGKKFDGN